MGGTSGSKSKGRRDKDKVDLKPVSRTGGNVDGSGGQSSSNANQICPTALEVQLREATKIPEGAKLALIQRDSKWIILYGKQELNGLSKERSDMLTRCYENGYRYSGVVRIRNGRWYGEFKRS